jgi:BirA family biotin operon repressor/biotin-[acetyl-CoA-carboxylase] ligase
VLSPDANHLGFEPDSILDGQRDLGLNTKWLCRRVHYLRSVDSTSTAIKALANRGAEPGTAVLADEQTGGRGRSGRTWFSPARLGLWMSVLYESALSPERLAPLSIAAAVAVAGALGGETGLDVRVKWPNDLLVGQRKLGGFLVESTDLGESRRVVLGVGLNVALAEEDIPAGLANSATSLAIELARSAQGPVALRRLDVLRIVAPALERCFEDYELEGIAGFRGRWRALSSMLGREVTVAPGTAGGPSGPLFTGVVTGLSESGALMLRFASGGTREIWFGDVALRDAASKRP